LTQCWPNTGAFHWRVTGPATTNAYLGLVARDSFYNFAADASDHSFQIVAATAVGEGPAGTVTLEPIAPNPTRGPGHVAVVLPGPGAIRLAILDVAGREVAVLADGFQPAGRHDFSWNGSGHAGSAPPGIYVARLESSGLVLTQKFVVAR
jgi:hypothetical protein